MCGIAGSISTRGATQAVLDKQLATMFHRGPDASGGMVRGPIALGQNRLAIIDLASGNPPLTDESGDITAVLNGEIYNFRELQEDLLTSGHIFRSGCDTEVLAHLAETTEVVALARRLKGMFAYAIWDERRHRLLLGRDPLGKKPLYYWQDGQTFVFGSEIKALLAHPAVPRRFDPSCIPTYLSLGYVPTPGTAFSDIKSLPPGHVAVVQAGHPADIRQYWAPPKFAPAEQLDIGLAEAADEVRRLVVAAVQRRMVADVPLGAFLSGGLDSSSVVAAMCEVAPGAVRTFTAGFDDDKGFDERPFAREVARYLGTEHTELVVHPDVPELLDHLVWHHDQPFGDSSALPTYLLSKATRAHVTVALCGDGGDELFGGYERFVATLITAGIGRAPRLARSIGRTARRFDGTVGSAPAQVRAGQRLLARWGDSPPVALHSWTSYVPNRWLSRLVPAAPCWTATGPTSLSYQEAWDESSGLSSLDRLLYVNLRTYLLDDLLPKVDRMAMAHGLEVRSPLLDVDLLEFCARLPAKLKIRGLTLKRVLRKAMEHRLPGVVLTRKKHGFGAPLDRWFRTELQPYVRSMICTPEARVRRYLVPESVDALVASHATGQENLGSPIWTLLTLESFLRQQGD